MQRGRGNGDGWIWNDFGKSLENLAMVKEENEKKKGTILGLAGIYPVGGGLVVDWNVGEGVRVIYRFQVERPGGNGG